MHRRAIHFRFRTRRGNGGRSSLPQGVLKAFTLIELMVVIGIIALLVALAVPAIGPMLRSSETAKTINLMTGMSVTAQVYAESLGTPVGLRIERAFVIKRIQDKNKYNNVPYDAIRDAAVPTTPEYLPWQQVRLVKFSDRQADATQTPTSSFQPAFEQLPDTRVTALPKTAWVAPIESIELDATTGTPLWQLDDASLRWQPTYWPNIKQGFPGYQKAGLTNPDVLPLDPALGYGSRLDTFYIIFDRFGGVRRFPGKAINTASTASAAATRYWYRDTYQPYSDQTGSITSPPDFPAHRSSRSIKPWGAGLQP